MDPARDQALASLLVLAQRGDRQAYEDFLAGACAVLRPFLVRRMAAPALAEDVLQETLLAIHRARRSYLPGRPVGPWLYTICEHRLADFHRQQRRLARLEARQADPPQERADEVESPAQRGGVVLDLLGRLPGRQRRVIELLKLQEMSVREVADQIGMSESAVKVTAFRGYEAIRRMMGAGRR